MLPRSQSGMPSPAAAPETKLPPHSLMEPRVRPPTAKASRSRRGIDRRRKANRIPRLRRGEAK
jgi:hypothetical protein